MKIVFITVLFNRNGENMKKVNGLRDGSVPSPLDILVVVRYASTLSSL